MIDLRESPDLEPRSASRRPRARRSRSCTAVILDRDRHAELIGEVRQAGARIRLIGDGDVSGAVMTANPDSGIDVLFGTGGAPEGVIAAAALRCVGGELQGRLRFRNDEERARADARWASRTSDTIYTTEELAQGDVMFAATGVTKGYLLDGVRFFGGGATHPVDRDALEVGHRPRHRRDPPLQHQAGVLHSGKLSFTVLPADTVMVRVTGRLSGCLKVRTCLPTGSSTPANGVSPRRRLPRYTTL